MKKGIIMEIDDAHLTLLTPNGEFLHATKRNQSYMIGEEILFFPIEKPTRNSHFTFIHLFKNKPLPIALVALFLFLGSLIPMYQSNKAYAYMSIDVNPSMELGVNKKMQVVKLTAFNHDGKKIISHISDWKKEDVSQLAQEILKEMSKQGYLKKNHDIIISTVRIEKPDKEAEENLTKNIDEIKKAVKENNLQLTVLSGTEKEMEKAHHLGITTGKYQELKLHDSSKNVTKKVQPELHPTEENTGNTIPQGNQSSLQLKNNHDNVGMVQNQVHDKKENKLNINNKNHAPSGEIKKPMEKVDEQKSRKQEHEGTKNCQGQINNKNGWYQNWYMQKQKNNEHEKSDSEYRNEHENEQDNEQD